MENTSYSDKDLERCTLHNKREIIFELRGLIKHGERISVLFNEGKQTFLTVLMEVSENKNLLYFDVGGSNDINQRFLKAEQSTFVTYVNGIRIQFSAKQGVEAKLNGERVLAVPIPEAMLRLQRREMFRLQLPSIKPFTCRVKRGSPDEKNLPLHDISIGGIGIRSLQPLDFEQLEVLESCWIDLHEAGMLNLNLEVRYVNELENRNGKTLWQMGCKFLNLTPANETLIQRFMAKLEAERRALSA